MRTPIARSNVKERTVTSRRAYGSVEWVCYYIDCWHTGAQRLVNRQNCWTVNTVYVENIPTGYRKEYLCVTYFEAAYRCCYRHLLHRSEPNPWSWVVSCVERDGTRQLDHKRRPFSRTLTILSWVSSNTATVLFKRYWPNFLHVLLKQADDFRSTNIDLCTTLTMVLSADDTSS